MRKITLLFIFFLGIYQAKAQETESRSIMPMSKLVFNYDAAGNQNQRFYCYDGNDCIVPDPPARITENESEDKTADLLENKFTIYPNPTKGAVSINWDISVKDIIQKIEIVGYHTPYYKEVSFRNTELNANIDLSREMQSIYIVQFTLKDQVITKKIIKL